MAAALVAPQPPPRASSPCLCGSTATGRTPELRRAPADVLLCWTAGASALPPPLVAGVGEEGGENMSSTFSKHLFNIFKILVQHFQNASSTFLKY